MSSSPRCRARLLEGYIGREYGKVLILSLAAFVSIFLVVDFFEKIDRLVKSELGLGEFTHYLLLKVPFALGQVLPPAVILAALLTFGLFSRSRETMAMRTAGLDILRLTRPVLVLAGAAAFLLAALNLFLVPWSQARLANFWETRVLKKPARSLVGLEQFWYKGDRAIYNILAFHKAERTLEGVTVYLFDEEFRLGEVVTAKKAVWDGSRWRFLAGSLQWFDATGAGSYEEFDQREFSLTEKPEDFHSLERKVGEMDWRELSAYVARLERDGYKSTLYRADLYSRFAVSLTPLILAVLGLGLILRYEGRYLPALVALGMGVMFLYWLTFGLGASFGQAGWVPLSVGIWLPHVLFAAGAGVLFSRAIR